MPKGSRQPSRSSGPSNKPPSRRRSGSGSSNASSRAGSPANRSVRSRSPAAASATGYTGSASKKRKEVTTEITDISATGDASPSSRSGDATHTVTTNDTDDAEEFFMDTYDKFMHLRNETCGASSTKTILDQCREHLGLDPITAAHESTTGGY